MGLRTTGVAGGDQGSDRRERERARGLSAFFISLYIHAITNVFLGVNMGKFTLKEVQEL